MKKLLFIILICLIYRTTLSTPITSPIYIPESGKILSKGAWTNCTASTTDAFGGFRFTFSSK